MKYTILLLILLFSSILLFSQKSAKQYVGLAIGPSFPVGNYSETNISDSTSGFAKTGIALEFTYSYRLTQNLGFQAIINYGSNGLDYKSYQSQLEEAHPGYTAVVEVSRNWSSGGIMVGPFLTLPISNQLSWDVKGLFGVYNAYSPGFIIYASDSLNLAAPPDEFIRQSANAISYGYLISTGFKYKLSNYYLLLFADYISSPLKFNNASGWDWNSEPYKASFNQDISFVTITLGLGYFF
ncbi:MAG TPA: hypothetical protein VIN10_15795 [Bacteroidales bacterium]